MDDWLKKLQGTIMSMNFVPLEQRERFATGIPYLPPEDLNRFLDLLMSLVCGETERLIRDIKRGFETAKVLTGILRETITEDGINGE